MISWRRRIILLFTALLLLAGFSGEKAILPDMPKDGKGTIKVTYFHEQTFHQKYGDLLEIKYRDIEIEVVGMDVLRDYFKEEKPGERLNQFIEKENRWSSQPCREMVASHGWPSGRFIQSRLCCPR